MASFDIDNFKKQIKNAEHHGNLFKRNIYKVRNSSGANGAYQFLDFWQDRIKEYADKEGYTFNSMQDFLNNSTLQDDFFEHYVHNELKPQANTLQQYNSSNLSQDQLLAGLHFLGYPKMRKVLESQDFDSPQSFKTSLNDYYKNAGLPQAQSFTLPEGIADIEEPILDFENLTPVDNTMVRIDTDEMLEVVEEPRPEPVQQNTSQPQTQYTDVLEAFFNDFEHGGEFKKQTGMVRLDTLEEYQDGGEVEEEDNSFLVHRSSDFIYHSDQYPEMKKTQGRLYESPRLMLPSGARYFEEAHTANKGKGASCTGAVCKATDDIMPRLGVSGLTQWREDQGFGSGSNHPDLDRYGESLDAWDIQGAIRERGGVANYTAQDYNDVKNMPDEEFENMIKGFSVGTVLNYTRPNNQNEGLNNQTGMIGGTHSAVVVGFNEEGIPVIFDYGDYRLASKTAMDGAYKLVNASTPAEYADFTFDNLQQRGQLNKTFEGKPLKLEPEKLQGKLYSDNKTGQTYNEKRMQDFAITLEESKEPLLNDLESIGSNEEYDQLANLAMAIAMAETRGGTKTLGSTADAIGLGDSVGMTQINEQTFFGRDEEGNFRDPVLADQVMRYGIKDKGDLFDDENSAIATMIYLATLKNRAESAYQKGMDAGERRYRADNSLKGKVRGLDKLLIEETGEKIDIPSKGASLDGKQAKRFNEKIAELGLQGRYRLDEDENGIYVAKRTVGNSPDLSLEEKIAYYWNTPSSLVSGDAQGRNEYVKKVLNYYNTLVGSE